MHQPMAGFLNKFYLWIHYVRACVCVVFVPKATHMK